MGVIGAVGTTALTVVKLLEYNFKIVGVLGHEPNNELNVSGLYDLKQLCSSNGVSYKGYIKINDTGSKRWMKDKMPDIIFAVGFSQMLDASWLKMPKYGCVGFHPTQLPEGRGRAPLAWLILDKKDGAATFFKMGDGMDDGPIYVQKKFKVEDEDDVETLIPKLHNAASNALDSWLPRLKSHDLSAYVQDPLRATYYGKRLPIDGQINWHHNASDIIRLIKASTRPYPGAFTCLKGTIIKIWKAELIKDYNWKGVVGRVLYVDENSFIVQCGLNHIKVLQFTSVDELQISVNSTFTVIQNQDVLEINKLILKS